MHSIDRDGDPMWRATSSSGGTQPRRNVGRMVICKISRSVPDLHDIKQTVETLKHGPYNATGMVYSPDFSLCLR